FFVKNKKKQNIIQDFYNYFIENSKFNKFFITFNDENINFYHLISEKFINNKYNLNNFNKNFITLKFQQTFEKNCYDYINFLNLNRLIINIYTINRNFNVPPNNNIKDLCIYTNDIN